MHTRSRSTFTSVHTEGSLLPVDLLQRVLSGDKDLGGLAPADYHLPGNEKLNEAVNRSWNRLQGAWAAFRTSQGRLKAGDPGTTLTRERWLLPLFQELGYGRLVTTRAIEIEGKAYPISHGWSNVPIHLVGCGIDLDYRAARVAGASRSSPHSLVQELLNRADDRQWGLLANGLRLRILRDNASLTRQAYLEFDLEAIFSGEVYADFVLLWLFCHQSRFESAGGKTGGCWLENWSKAAQERGTRALDQLRSGVEEAISALGSGFLSHPADQELRKKLRSGELDAQDYYRQLLRLVYRLIFLFAAEDRDLLLDPQADAAARDRYLSYYSTARLRRLAERQRGGRHADLWQALKLVTDILAGSPLPELGEGQGVRALGLPVLNGFLFSEEALPDLEASLVDNQSLLNAVRSLAFTVEGGSRRAVDYKNLGPEELGSVYESLLELHPRINSAAGTFELTSASGHERKTTGSYYTPTSLIQVLLDSALDPVIEQALDIRDSRIESGKDESRISTLESHLLNLKVCDPACGSGHFLIAAAHRIARRLARLRSGDDEPAPAVLRAALREVIARCIYGVDVNPMAVELCKVNLWLESIEPGKPLSFLDAHIQCGDSLVGVGPGLDISEIPDDAFNPAFGDDKATATALKKRNKCERSGQLGFRWKVTVLTSPEDLACWRAERAGQVDAMPDDDPVQVQAKAQAYAEFLETRKYIQNRFEYDFWTAAFFWRIAKGDAEHMLAPTQQELVMLRSGVELDARLVEQVQQMAEHLNFFHWGLAFSNVFSGENPGFDCILGNPPWERVKLQEEEFFAQRDPEIAAAPNKASRQKLINLLTHSNPTLALAFEEAKHLADTTNKFIRMSGRFPLTAVGDVNTYALFAELSRDLTSTAGRLGIIVKSGIATDATYKDFFADVANKKQLISFYDFENRDWLFSDVATAGVKFCLMTLTLRSTTSSDFAFFCTRVEDINNPIKRFSIPVNEITIFNPNSKTLPTFRTSIDAVISKRIYNQIPVLVNEQDDTNLWGISFLTLFHMANDSSLFQTQATASSLPLYEPRMIHIFDHRWSTYNGDIVVDVSIAQKNDPSFHINPNYWVNRQDVLERLRGRNYRNYLIGLRNITRPGELRTVISTVIPLSGVGHNMPIIFLDTQFQTNLTTCFLANLNSIPFDYFARQKISGASIDYFRLRQLPVLPPSTYTPIDIGFIASRVLELVYTAYDIRSFAEDMGYHGEPFRWDEDRRALLRAELDAYYARLYGLTRDELRYILDPQDVYGPDFPGETFRVLKEKEIRQFGEYRTRRLVLEAWDRLEGVERVEEIVQPLQPTIDLPTKIDIRQPLPEITWIPVTLAHTEVAQKQGKPNYRQVVGVAWLLANFGTGQSIPLFDAQKFCYFLQRKNLANLDIPYREFARGPYSPQVTYKAGAYAKNKNYWEVRGSNIARRRNMKEAVDAADNVFTDIKTARQLIERLAQMTKDDIGGLSTVDFAAREVFARGKAITPDNIRAYFLSDWPEKVMDPWYTDENIYRAMEMLSELGLFEKSSSAVPQTPEVEEPAPEVVSQPMLPHTLADFGLYKCQACGKMVMGFDRENHARDEHRSKTVEWKKMR